MFTRIITILQINVILVQGTDINVTYFDQKKSWTDAKTFCFNNGGILESNTTILKERFRHISDVWLGTYNILTEWRALKGCYDMSSQDLQKTNTLVSSDYLLECQKLCPNEKFEFFSIKDRKCHCINFAIHPVWKRHFNECSCTECSNQYHKLYKQNVKEDRRGLSDTNGCGLCLAVVCVNKDVVLTSETCSETYGYFCDATDILIIPKSYEQGDAECKKQGSFIQWYGSNLCSKYAGTKTLWTNAKRDIETVRLTTKDILKKIDPKFCGVLNKENQYFDICDKHRAFFCRFDVTEGISSTTTPGTIAGVLIAVTVLVCFLVLILGVCVFNGRRLTQRSKTTKERETIPADSYDNFRNENLRRNEIENSEHVADELDYYAENSEYDHLNNARKAKDDTCHKVYDHMITSTGSNPTYDHSSFRYPVSVNENYDTFSSNQTE